MKLVLLTSERFGLASDCLVALRESHNCNVVQVVLCRSAYPSLWRAWRQKLRKLWQIGPLGALVGLYMGPWYEGHRTADLAMTCDRLGIPFSEVPFTNSDDTTRIFEQCGAELGLSIGNGYISPKIFKILRYGMLNVHFERLPEYQNARSIIWPIYFAEVKTGVTIHQVNSRIDGGDILYKKEHPILFHSKLGFTVRETFGAVLRSTPAAVRYVCENYECLVRAAEPQENGRTFTSPGISQCLRMVCNNRKLHRLVAERARVMN